MSLKLQFIRWLTLATVFISTVFAVYPQQADAQTVQRFEYNNLVPTDNTSAYGINWIGQSFTSDNVSHTIVYVRLYLRRVGAPGTSTLIIRKTSVGLPTGTDLATVTIAQTQMSTAGAWTQVNLTTAITLDARTQYCIILKAPDGDSSNYVQWKRGAASTLPNGTALTSSGGVDWSTQTYDFMFEVWGITSVEIQSVKVFQSYKETGDWLIVVRYLDIYAPYYDTYDVRKYFVLQLLNASDNVTAETAIPAWGNRVSCIYLSAASVTGLTWGSVAYDVRIRGLFTGNPVVSHTFTTSDWRGTDLTELDSWVISSAAVIGTYYSTTLTTYVAGRGEVLNETGGSIFDMGISGLSIIRPNLYQIYSNKNPYNPTTVAQAGRNSVVWQTNVGPDAVVEATRIGNMFGVTGDLIISFIFLLMMIALAAWGFPAGHTTAANVLSVPMIFVGAYFGVNWMFIGAMCLVALLLFVKRFWGDTGA